MKELIETTEHGDLPPRSALKRTGRKVQKLSSEIFGLRKDCFFYVLGKSVGLGVDSDV